MGDKTYADIFLKIPSHILLLTTVMTTEEEGVRIGILASRRVLKENPLRFRDHGGASDGAREESFARKGESKV
jgi:hypothetical protein